MMIQRYSQFKRTHMLLVIIEDNKVSIYAIVLCY